jgi:hypothetical protein
VSAGGRLDDAGGRCLTATIPDQGAPGLIPLAVQLVTAAGGRQHLAGGALRIAVLCQNDAPEPLQRAVDRNGDASGAESSAGGSSNTAGDPFPSAVGLRTTVVRSFLAAVGLSYCAGEFRHPAAGTVECAVGWIAVRLTRVRTRWSPLSPPPRRKAGGQRCVLSPDSVRYRPLRCLSGLNRSGDSVHTEGVPGPVAFSGPRRLQAETGNAACYARRVFRSAVRDGRSAPTTHARGLAHHHGPITSIRWSARITYWPGTEISSCTM